MKEFLLAVDIGNSHTTVGLYRGEQLISSWRLASKTPRTADEIWQFLAFGLAEANLKNLTNVEIAIASVVPALTRIYSEISQEKLQKSALVIEHSHVKNLHVKYSPPSAVGADRLCGAAAAFAQFGGPLIVADLGTATVFDAVTVNGDYLGGAIAPGVATAVDALHAAAALLPNVELRFPENIIGSSTETAIQSGILYGALDMIDGIVTRMKAELGNKTTVIATGGFAELLKSRSKTIQHVEPNLVLEGIRLVASWQ